MFCGGNLDALLRATGCPRATVVFYLSTSNGGFVVWLPGSSVPLVNLEFVTRFRLGIPFGTIFVGRCF